MDKFNGFWKFYYSEEQAEEQDNETYVLLGKDDWQQYTEMVHAFHTKRSDYKSHEKRFEDSKVVARINNPTVKEGE